MTASPWQWALVIVLIVTGLLLAGIAWKMAIGTHQASTESGVLAGIGGGLITGFAVSLSVFFLQHSFEKTQEEATWRANVQLTSRISGFDPHHHSIKGLSFEGKELLDANFRGMNLKGYSFRDAKLHGAVFDDADLRGANFTGADLSEASLRRVNLDRALLLSTRMHLTDLRGVRYKKTQANYLTCWPRKFFSSVIRSGGLRPMPKWELGGVTHQAAAGTLC
ncbi:pentapeptide repeat-containing protein [Streptomyces sp. 5-8]|uniref:Pentapeptide repeat-containing protein n=1 Tax=Streptomyces musisoli TaxID=2802280 RepID=A0ABS1PEP0_9ACTN|nr:MULTISPECIES: pentapeptide repeat-containing protein [Streptomyces]MBL1110604.1 pentapeptide repeat-containing protein [Streptomyces musisoli]MBY8846200.1 pentapeptide repeat-containing protein [Streptomyces sp. SP2-10]